MSRPLNREALFSKDLAMKQDDVLERLHQAIDPVMEEIDGDAALTRGALVIGGIEALSDSGEPEGVVSMIDCSGDYSIIQEALYTELLEAIQGGDTGLFQALREVIHKVEEDLDLEPGAPLEDKRTLH